MKILHTSDWHLGRRLYGRTRYPEFTAFLDWLVQTIEAQQVDALVVSGDIFDTGTPGNLAQNLYYNFLCQVAEISSCRNIVVVAGNHDSPSFLEAPKQVLQHLHIHVIGSMRENPEEELLLLEENDGQPGLLLAAVPYLRDRDVRVAEAGESGGEKTMRLVEGIEAHYREAGILAEAQRRRLNLPGLPLAATGHLFTAGGRTAEGDGVRDLYVGNLALVKNFPECFDYLALGHLHVPQRVGGVEHIRYSGSPIPMGFGEARQQKEVLLVEFSRAEKGCRITSLKVPYFQRLESVEGDLAGILTGIEVLKEKGVKCWLEAVYTAAAAPKNLRQQIEEAVEGSGLEVLRVKNSVLAAQILQTARAGETLDDLDEFEVFQRCLSAAQISEEEQGKLVECYEEIVRDLREEDSNRE
ncbi:exonuclease SbcCD subunit D C-terminal domain-containing protein [Desulforhopalus vacuolatus]|uniref:exonuclease SbcCD subunit D C-terminal domain-containing protein n=1 Tax=Desulforhopalus vacuolatus TaxID=40414 RepID=UPI001963B2D5|nr:exonuclease SbcCD subunit D C-terminal domain-containing protein [Desulforhopalus vacuolatus]MBM9519287.1 exonuclease SbcCD subunit D C-terminal domain-containing protein [Desulforhopalus vacuolatus]